MLGKSLSQFAFPRQFISKSLNSRNRVDPLSPRETPFELRQFTGNPRKRVLAFELPKKKEGKKTKELKGEKRQLRADYACAQRKKQEEKMAGSDIVRGGRNKREVETLNALTIHHQLVKELTRTENCCPCKISCQIVNFK